MVCCSCINCCLLLFSDVVADDDAEVMPVDRSRTVLVLLLLRRSKRLSWSFTQLRILQYAARVAQQAAAMASMLPTEASGAPLQLFHRRKLLPNLLQAYLGEVSFGGEKSAILFPISSG